MLTYKQLLILLAVEALDERSRSCRIAQLIMDTTHGHKCMGTSVYAMIYNLEARGLVKQWVGPDAPFKFWSITAKGQRAMEASIKELEEMIYKARRRMQKAAA
jgi:DNA-binding MarR family transcriptional regulator